jgi:signal transduction histidine kinase
LSNPFSFKSIRFKIAIAFFGVFLLVISVSNYFLFNRVRSSIIDTYHQGIKVEAESIAQSLAESPTEVPITKEDQPIQIWFKSGFESQKFYERTDFPDAYSDLFSVLQDEAYVPEMESSIILELDSFTFCLVEKQILNGQIGVVSLILAKQNQLIFAQISSIKTWMVVANIGAALLSFVVALLVASYTLRPIRQLTERTKSIKASQAMERLPVSKANDELTELAETINDMIQRIESSIQSQNQFFASAAHELRTPLANMLAELDLRLSSTEESNHEQVLSSQREEVIRLKYVVQDFLLMSQLKTETLTLHTSRFRIDELLYDVLEKMNHSIKANGFQVGISLHTNRSMEINGDQAKTESILVNIIQNSLKYGDNSQRIEITVIEEKSVIELVLKNKIDVVRQAQSGNRLGLWICGQLAKKQGFKFNSMSNSNEFTVSLITPLV